MQISYEILSETETQFVLSIKDFNGNEVYGKELLYTKEEGKTLNEQINEIILYTNSLFPEENSNPEIILE